MNYQRVYHAFIAHRRERQPESGERHHVFPRALGGTDDEDNLIVLTPGDHLFAHVLLARIHGGSMSRALMFMTSRQRYAGRTSRRHYEFARREVSAAMRGNRLSDRRCYRVGWRHSPETIRKMAAAKTGRPNKKLTPEQVDAMRARQTGRKDSEQARANKSRAARLSHERRREQAR